MSTHLIIPDPHAHYQHNNNRASWLGNLICDVKPDVVINIGDTWDMPSLSGFDKGKKQFQGRTYAQDVAAGIDFNDRLWEPMRKAKRRMPRRVFLVGNHEQRIDRAINSQPELDGAIGYRDLQLERYYDETVHYSGDTPGTITIDGVTYSHYFVSGVMGRAIGGEYPADSLLSKKHSSCTQGHTHVFAMGRDTRVDGKKLIGCVAGCYQDYNSDWAGEVNKLWDRGVIVKRNVEDGHYDYQWISIQTLKREYNGS
jgi:hypothetical protein